MPDRWLAVKHAVYQTMVSTPDALIRKMSPLPVGDSSQRRVTLGLGLAVPMVRETLRPVWEVSFDVNESASLSQAPATRIVKAAAFRPPTSVLCHRSIPHP